MSVEKQKPPATRSGRCDTGGKPKMRLNQTTPRSAILALALSGTLGLIAPALAQNPGKTSAMDGQGEKTTAAKADKKAEKGTAANPGGPGEMGTTAHPGATGTGPRGTKVAPS